MVVVVQLFVSFEYIQNYSVVVYSQSVTDGTVINLEFETDVFRKFEKFISKKKHITFFRANGKSEISLRIFLFSLFIDWLIDCSTSLVVLNYKIILFPLQYQLLKW